MRIVLDGVLIVLALMIVIRLDRVLERDRKKDEASKKK
jgi:hypothetical protein